MKKDAPSYLEILPNRVRRNYRGGALLESWTGEGHEGDSERPEDWIGSTVRALNPGLAKVQNEGLTSVRLPDGRSASLPEVLTDAPEYFLGPNHVKQRGHELGFLAKLLDSAIRLNVQAHPTAAFAREHLNSPYGKFETYVVLAVREGANPYLRLGFQHAPEREEWRRIIDEQDIPAMDACFEPIPLKTGEVWRVPGGYPHAIGEGALVLEVMEPSDWVVRCEFEREGIVVPPQGRFMQRGLEFCLNVFDYASRSVSEIREFCRLEPKTISKNTELTVEQLVDETHTDCFSVRRLTLRGETRLPRPGAVGLYLVSHGEGELHSGEQPLGLKQGSRFLIPAGAEAPTIVPTRTDALQLLLCLPTLQSTT
ncbi:class I mannose-6-phosphate isomerase [Puniceicoccus vermicola]|uniref:Mannose-6-phosphate isomerase n=1 Tax=Puniceicoccus vermicola TaxID=388746 RepID=A0A7X1AZ34_9BACT|nr:class I mannose-6-phosphate isomerase [Puniceicoccus vermicola]MBC2601588.1 mannose-6-phosphate isomerase [Puniceicoccus vermicola]